MISLPPFFKHSGASREGITKGKPVPSPVYQSITAYFIDFDIKRWLLNK